MNPIIREDSSSAVEIRVLRVFFSVRDCDTQPFVCAVLNRPIRGRVSFLGWMFKGTKEGRE